MKARLFSFFVILSLLGFALTLFLNVRSAFWGADRLEYLNHDGKDFQEIFVTSKKHAIEMRISYGAYTPNSYRPNGFSFEYVPRRSIKYYIYYEQRLDFDTPTFWEEWGWHFSKSDYAKDTDIWITLPYWLLYIIFSIFPFLWWRKKRRLKKIKAKGCCQTCGYDLRATPGRCPECGTVSL